VKSTLDWDSILDETADIEVSDSFEPLPIGDYSAIVLEVEPKTASTGNEMLAVTFKITEDPDHDGEFENRRVWTNIVFAVSNPRAMALTIKRLNALGISREWLANNRPSQAQIARKITGAEAIIAVGQREWESKVRNEVNAIKPMVKTMERAVAGDSDDDSDDDDDFRPPARSSAKSSSRSRDAF
jgi:hypothetical protein